MKCFFAELNLETKETAFYETKTMQLILSDTLYKPQKQENIVFHSNKHCFTLQN